MGGLVVIQIKSKYLGTGYRRGVRTGTVSGLRIIGGNRDLSEACRPPLWWHTPNKIIHPYTLHIPQWLVAPESNSSSLLEL